MKVLFTKAYSNDFISNILPDYKVEHLDFIKTQRIDKESFISTTEKYENFIVSSAKSARYALDLNLKGNYFCVGEKSKKILKTKFNVAECEPNAKSLSEKIISKYKDKKFCFLCSNVRLNTISNELEKNKIDLKECVIYKTIEIQPEISEKFDAYVFFSPSGVKSFSKKYTIPNKALIFAIGSTTQNAVKELMSKVALIPEKPDLNSLINLIKEKTNAEK
ncbi:uroporphyrinogen-III synthase [Weeksellaceae bacterium TAE3-ERU29]|nr:uroporphyrinogen-III synthase [Weeksellaceae bacterium TAE3-ERU29]